MEKLIFIFLLAIIILLVLIFNVLLTLHEDLKQINNSIVDAHPKLKYTKAYESKRYETKIF